MTQRLTVHLDFGSGSKPALVGQLGRDEKRRISAFEWDQGFAMAQLPVAPFAARSHGELLLPNPDRGATLPGLFEDSLPDGWGKLLLDREIEARGISRSEIGDRERLAYVGHHGAGALTYTPEINKAAEEKIDLAWFEEIIPQVEDGASVQDLSRLRTISGGSQGARPKFVAQIHENMVDLRDHRSAVTDGWQPVLIKGRASVDPIGGVQAEAAYGALMRSAGINTNDMFVLQGAKELFFGTVRFDRPGTGRLHVATVAGVLDIGTMPGTIEYIDIIKVVKQLCRSAEAVEEMFRRMVFNVRAFNRDDHSRNHAFLMNAAGEWSLAPAYDVSFSQGPGGEHSMAIAGEGRVPGRAAIEAVAKNAGIKPPRRDAIIDEVDAALSNWEQVARDFDVPNRMIKLIKSEIKAARARK